MILTQGEQMVWAVAFKSAMGKCPPDMDVVQAARVGAAAAGGFVRAMRAAAADPGNLAAEDLLMLDVMRGKFDGGGGPWC
jgi:hypothetical protein